MIREARSADHQSTDQERHALHSKLEEMLGPVHSANLMASLPPRDWDDIATKQDLEVLRLATRQDLENMRQDIEALRLATKQDIEVLRNEIRAELQQTRADLQHTIAVNTRTVLLANVVVLATFVSTLL